MTIMRNRIEGTRSAGCLRGESAAISRGHQGHSRTHQTPLGDAAALSAMPGRCVNGTTKIESMVERLVLGDPARIVERIEEYQTREDQGCAACAGRGLYLGFGRYACVAGITPGQRGFCPAWRMLVDAVA